MKYLASPSQGMEHPVPTISSSDLEKSYLAYCVPGSDAQAATLKFQAGKHEYELDFKGTSDHCPPPAGPGYLLPLPFPH